ncbi:hypothetical protein PCANC_25097 [Puccinia coronata f. sp. avenae]|uniref:Uncharacterized protein n=1 Tax=Puccinia coronata f. sp. avenae TaxID=200324 RepID=A0A2N5S1X7_9BASI|nr:hypothetical protein PCANC_28157 [Puccinia coronata f. sp. avenae]PLW35770.1 hypothetical protein PCANC_25097 [Puccinia coronata f. sp. avenae]
MARQDRNKKKGEQDCHPTGWLSIPSVGSALRPATNSSLPSASSITACLSCATPPIPSKLSQGQP